MADAQVPAASKLLCLPGGQILVPASRSVLIAEHALSRNPDYAQHQVESELCLKTSDSVHEACEVPDRPSQEKQPS
jgi:hypothetical protein